MLNPKPTQRGTDGLPDLTGLAVGDRLWHGPQTRLQLAPCGGDWWLQVIRQRSS